MGQYYLPIVEIEGTDNCVDGRSMALKLMEHSWWLIHSCLLWRASFGEQKVNSHG